MANLKVKDVTVVCNKKVNYLQKHADNGPSLLGVKEAGLFDSFAICN